MSGIEAVSERSGLLDSEIGRSGGNGQEEEGRADRHGEREADDEYPAREASTKELLAVMGATWLGIFFAALGM